jgi:hypothetical protein
VKRILTLLLVLLAVSAGCRHHIRGGIQGSGKLLKQTREVGAFNSISTEGAFELKVVCQKPQRLEIAGDENILQFVTTEVSNNVLHVKNERSYSASEPITLEISVPDLVALSVSGAGSVEVNGVKNEKFVIDANGAPAIRAAGETNSLTIDANGAGKVDTHKLRAQRVVVDSKGVARVEVYAAQQLDVTVSGPASVVYEGAANVNKTINGPGSVEKKESKGA